MRGIKITRVQAQRAMGSLRTQLSRWKSTGGKSAPRWDRRNSAGFTHARHRALPDHKRVLPRSGDACAAPHASPPPLAGSGESRPVEYRVPRARHPKDCCGSSARSGRSAPRSSRDTNTAVIEPAALVERVDVGRVLPSAVRQIVRHGDAQQAALGQQLKAVGHRGHKVRYVLEDMGSRDAVEPRRVAAGAYRNGGTGIRA